MSRGDSDGELEREFGPLSHKLDAQLHALPPPRVPLSASPPPSHRTPPARSSLRHQYERLLTPPPPPRAPAPAPCLKQERAHQSFEAKRCRHAETRPPSEMNLLNEAWAVGLVVLLLLILFLGWRRLERQLGGTQGSYSRRPSIAWNPPKPGSAKRFNSSWSLVSHDSNGSDEHGGEHRGEHRGEHGGEIVDEIVANVSAAPLGVNAHGQIAEVVLMADQVPPPRRLRWGKRRAAPPHQVREMAASAPVAFIPPRMPPPSNPPRSAQQLAHDDSPLAFARALLNGDLVI